MGAQQQQQQTQTAYEAEPPSASSSGRPTLGFPLGTALLLVVIFCLSGVLSCCYHWEKLQSLRRRGLRRRRHQPDDEENPSNGGAQAAPGAVLHGIPSPPSKAAPMPKCGKQGEDRMESLPVIMPGDRIPKFIAWPTPCDPPPLAAPPPPPRVPHPDKITVDDLSPPAPPASAVPCVTTQPDAPAPQEHGQAVPSIV